jgi:MarR family 2-MHQ and catechol resistance regulon transcriptional repressor
MGALNRALKAITTPLRANLEQQGLLPTEFGVLEALYHRGPLTLGEIAAHILVTGASTTYTVKKLEERGLIRRQQSAEDQRVVIGELTAGGRALIAEVYPAHAEELRRLMRGLSRKDKVQATRMLVALGRAAATSERSIGDEAYD